VIIGRGPIYTVEEVSDLLGIPRPTLYRYLREYSIPHLRRSGRISIPEESFERIREARDLHKEGLGTASVRRLLREGGNPNSGELKERLDQLSENLESLRGNERPTTEEALPSYALRTILARQNLLISAMFDLTEMVEELLLASGKPRKAVFDDVGAEIRDIAPLPETSKGIAAAAEPSVKPSRPARFGSLSRRRRRALLAILSALLAGLLLTWALPTLGGQLPSGLPFSDGRERGSSPGAPEAPPEDKGAAQNPPAGAGTSGSGASGAREAERVQVPDVSDRDVLEAARDLSRAGFEVGAIKTVKSRKEAGTVMRTKPTTAAPGEPVTLVASGGPTGIPPGLRSGGARSSATAQYAN
jgi:excisionase family DNA binding protein